MKVNLFVKNAAVPMYRMILMERRFGMLEPTYVGPAKNVPEALFNRADEAHVHPDYYDLLAEHVKGKEIVL